MKELKMKWICSIVFFTSGVILNVVAAEDRSVMIPAKIQKSDKQQPQKDSQKDSEDGDQDGNNKSQKGQPANPPDNPPTPPAGK